MTWIETTPGFGTDNLPYGVASTQDGRRRIVVRVGDAALDLEVLVVEGLLPPECAAGSLDPLLAAGPQRWSEVRDRLTALLEADMDRPAVERSIVALSDLVLHLPFTVADYVDFYSSEAHATNVGRLFRPDGDALLENWRHLPVGYHGRSGTVVVSGTPVRRPLGQRRGEAGPQFGPSRRLDFEVEMGFVVGVPSRLGEPVDVDDAESHVFGAVLLNDWSARDIQAWEYRPLGPFLGKSFATTVSPWVVPMAALEASRVPGPLQEPQPLSYLRSDRPGGFAIELTASVASGTMLAEGAEHLRVTRTEFGGMYWTLAQQLAHLTVNGASLRTGDLIGSGTVSGWEPGTFGSLLEISRNGEQALELPDGSTRTFLRDGDEVVLGGVAGSVSFGRARGIVTAAV